MTIRYVLALVNKETWDSDWQIPAKEAFFAEYELQFPQGECETKESYQDRITGVVQDTMVKLARDNITLHTDRLTDPIEHPTDPNKILSVYDDTKIGDNLNVAYYQTQSWRDTYGGSVYTDISQAEAEAEGFDFGTEE